MDEFESSLNDLLVDTFFTILKYESQALKRLSKLSVTISEAHMIEQVARFKNQATISQISSALQLAMPTVTIAIQKMQRKGYVEKTPCEDDGRRTYIRLTELGERINRAHTMFHRRMVRNISDQFQPDEKEILLRTISKLQTFFSQQAMVAA